MGDLLSDLHVVGAAILRGGRCLVALRGPAMREAGRWEFPGGQVEPGESPAEALVREIHEELGCRVRPGKRLGGVRAPAAGRTIHLEVFEAEVLSGEPVALEHERLLWAAPDELGALDWAPADIPIVPAVIERLERSTRETGA